ncbi:MAG TPA: hypothetical protein VF014_15005, partial [Casimicrobiaceae bacterium]|nr:hypothetical protein [Casimicrobiaceae bacterium]
MVTALIADPAIGGGLDFPKRNYAGATYIDSPRYDQKLRGQSQQRRLGRTLLCAAGQETVSVLGRWTFAMTRQDRWIVIQGIEHDRVSRLPYGDPTLLGCQILCGLRSRQPDETYEPLLAAPHTSEHHITHKMCSSTFDAGKSHARFDEGGQAKQTMA